MGGQQNLCNLALWPWRKDDFSITYTTLHWEVGTERVDKNVLETPDVGKNKENRKKSGCKIFIPIKKLSRSSNYKS